MTVRCPEIMDPLSFVRKESPLRSGYESSGDPRGRLTKRFPSGGRGALDRIGIGLKIPTLYALGGLMTSCFAGRVTHESFTVLRRGPPCADVS